MKKISLLVLLLVIGVAAAVDCSDYTCSYASGLYNCTYLNCNDMPHNKTIVISATNTFQNVSYVANITTYNVTLKIENYTVSINETDVLTEFKSYVAAINTSAVSAATCCMDLGRINESLRNSEATLATTVNDFNAFKQTSILKDSCYATSLAECDSKTGSADKIKQLEGSRTTYILVAACVGAAIYWFITSRPDLKKTDIVVQKGPSYYNADALKEAKKVNKDAV
jgi:hypothetical protein